MDQGSPTRRGQGRTSFPGPNLMPSLGTEEEAAAMNGGAQPQPQPQPPPSYDAPYQPPRPVVDYVPPNHLERSPPRPVPLDALDPNNNSFLNPLYGNQEGAPPVSPSGIRYDIRDELVRQIGQFKDGIISMYKAPIVAKPRQRNVKLQVDLDKTSPTPLPLRAGEPQPQVIEKLVEVPVEKIVEKVVYVDRPVPVAAPGYDDTAKVSTSGTPSYYAPPPTTTYRSTVYWYDRLWDWTRQWWKWLLLLLLLLLLILLVLLAVLLTRDHRRAPDYRFQPQVIDAGPTSADLSLGITRKGVVRYAIFDQSLIDPLRTPSGKQIRDVDFSRYPLLGSGRRLLQSSAADIPATLCGEIAITKYKLNYTLTTQGVTTLNMTALGTFFGRAVTVNALTSLGFLSEECKAALTIPVKERGALERRFLCDRCGALLPGRGYVMFLVALDPAKAAIGPVRSVSFSTQDTVPPSFTSGPNVFGVQNYALSSAFSVSKPALVYWAIYLDQGETEVDDSLVAFRSAGPGTAETLRQHALLVLNGIGSNGLSAGGVYNSTIALADNRLDLSPDCAPDLCRFNALALIPNTSYSIYFTPEDYLGNLQPIVSRVAFRTLARTLPPVPTPVPENITGSSFDVALTMDTRGLMCFLIVEPTAQNIDGSTALFTGVAMQQRCNELYNLLTPPCPIPDPIGPFDAPSSRRKLLSGDDAAFDLFVEDGGATTSRLPPSRARILQTIASGNSTLCLNSGNQLCTELLAGFFVVDDVSKVYTLNIRDVTSQTLFQIYVKTQDRALIPNVLTNPVIVPVRTLDITPPLFVNQTPAFGDIGKTTAQVIFAINEPGTVFFEIRDLLTPRLNTTTLIARASTLSSGTASFVGESIVGRLSLATAYRNGTMTVTGLTPGLCYAMYATAEDVAPPPGPNIQPDPTSGPYTLCTDDAIPPAFVTYGGDSFTSTTFNVTASLNKTGDYYFIVLSGDVCAATLPAFPPLTVKNCLIPAPYQGIFIQCGTVGVPLVYPANFSGYVQGVQQKQTYSVQLIAQDRSRVPNLQASTTCFKVTIPDVTPPDFSGVVAAVNATSITTDLTISEPGVIFYVLARRCSLLPGSPGLGQPMTALRLTQLVSIFTSRLASGTIGAVPDLANVTDAGTVNYTDAGTLRRVLTRNVTEATRYYLYLGARDVVGNLNATVLLLPATTADVTPPQVVPCPLPALQLGENSFRLNYTFQEPATAYAVVLAADAPAPTASEVLAGTASGGLDPIFFGTVDAFGTPGVGNGTDANCSSKAFIGQEQGLHVAPFAGSILVTGLARTTPYRVYTIAEDLSGNAPATVCAFPVTTPDLTPPNFIFMMADLLDPSILRVQVSLDSTGTVFFIAVLNGTVPPLATDVFNLQGVNGTAPAFSGVIDVPTAGQTFTFSTCGVDVTQNYTVYAVAQDKVTPTPNRTPAYVEDPASSVSQNDQAVEYALATCTNAFLTANLRPSLRVAGTANAYGLGSEGIVSDGVFSRTFSALGFGTLGANVTLESLISTVPRVVLPNQNLLPVTVPAAASAIVSSGLVTSISLILQGGGTVTQDTPTVNFKFQVRDESGSTVVSTSNLIISGNLTINGTLFPLGSCGGTIDATTGVGSCGLFLPQTAFGSVSTGSFQIAAFYASALAARSAVGTLSLVRTPTYPTVTTSGIDVQMPLRSLYPGESFDAVFTARTGDVSLRRWVIPIYYDTARLQYVQVTSYAANLWSTYTINDATPGRIAFTTSGRANGVQVSETLGDSVSIMTVRFRVVSTLVAGTYDNSLSVGVFNPPSNVDAVIMIGEQSVDAYNLRTTGTIRDARGTLQQSFQMQVVSPSSPPAGVYASFTDGRGVLYNLAPLSGSTSSYALVVNTVSNFPAARGGPATDAVSTPTATCSVPAAFSSVYALSGCTVNLSPSASAGGAVTVSVTAQGVTVSAPFLVFYPSSVQTSLSDAMLSRVVDTRHPDYVPFCSAPQYQNATASVVATLSAGSLTIPGADVTALASSFASNDTSVVDVTGTSVVASAAGFASISAIFPTGATIAPAPAVLVVSDTLLCVIGMNVVATTGATAAVSVSRPTSLQSVNMTVTTAQNLNRETSVASLRGYLLTADGLVRDVTPLITFDTLEPALFNITTAASTDPQLRVQVSLGSPKRCGTYVRTRMVICGVAIGSGNGPIRLALPAPVRIVTFTIEFPKISPANDPATFAPISLPTAARLTVTVAFDDGTTIDLSQDSRAVYTFDTGNDTAIVTRNAQNVGTVSSLNATSFGSAIVRVSFPAFNVPTLTATVQVQVVGYNTAVVVMRDYNYQLAVRPSDANGTATQPLLFHRICTPSDADAYMQGTAWHRVQLTDDTVWDVTGSATQAFALDPSTVARFNPNLANPALLNRFRPLAAGQATISGTWRGRTTDNITITVDDSNKVNVVSVALSLPSTLCSSPSSPLCPQTFNTDANSQWPDPLELVIVLNSNSYTTYQAFTGQARIALDIMPTDALFTFAATASALTINPFGDVTLRANYYTGIVLTATWQCPGVNSASSAATAYANLDPRAGDVDFGELYGPQFQMQPVSTDGPVLPGNGQSFDAEIRVNSGTKQLQSITVLVEFNSSILRTTDCSLPSAISPQAWGCTINSPTNQVLLSTAFSASDTGMVGTRPIGTVRFQVVAASGAMTMSTTIVDLIWQDFTQINGVAAIAADGPFVAGGSRRLLELDVRDADARVASPMLLEGFATLRPSGHRRRLLRTEDGRPAMHPAYPDLVLGDSSGYLGSQAMRGLHSAPVGVGRRVLQGACTCTLEVHTATYGDLDGDCRFGTSDWTLMLIMNAGAYSRQAPTAFYTNFEAIATQIRNPAAVPCWSGLSDHQIDQLDFLQQYYSSLPTSDPEYRARWDNSTNPFSSGNGYTPSALDYRPANSRAFDIVFRTYLTQQYFMTGMFLNLPRGSGDASLSVQILDEASDPVAAGVQTRITFEIKPVQSLLFTNPAGAAANPRRTATGTYVVPADALTNGTFQITFKSPTALGVLTDEIVPTGVWVERFDASGSPFQVDPTASFFPYYDSANKPSYAVQGSFVPYTLARVVVPLAFLPGYPNAINIMSSTFVLYPGATRDCTIFYVAIERSSHSIAVDDLVPSLSISPAAIKSPASTPVLQSTSYVTGSFSYLLNATSNGLTGTSGSLSGLNVSRVYDVFILAERTVPGAGGGLDQTMGVLLNVTTRDLIPPNIVQASIQPLIPSTPDDLSNSLQFNVSLRLSEPATVYFSVYRSCHACSAQPTLTELVNNASPAHCDRSNIQCLPECDPVAPLSGTSAVRIDDNLDTFVVLDVNGYLIDPNQAITRAMEATCFSAPIVDECHNFVIYITAKDGLVTLNSKLAAACAVTSYTLPSPWTSAGFSAGNYCAQPASAADDPPNFMSGAYVPWSFNSSAAPDYTLLAQGRPLKANITVDVRNSPNFTPSPVGQPVVTSFQTSAGAQFGLDKPGMLVYRVFNLSTDGNIVGGGGGSLQGILVSNGRFVVDPSMVGVLQNISIAPCASGIPTSPTTFTPGDSYILEWVFTDLYYLRYGSAGAVRNTKLFSLN